MSSSWSVPASQYVPIGSSGGPPVLPSSPRLADRDLQDLRLSDNCRRSAIEAEFLTRELWAFEPIAPRAGVPAAKRLDLLDLDWRSLPTIARRHHWEDTQFPGQPALPKMENAPEQ